MPSSPKMEVNYCIIAMTSQATAMTVKSFHVVTVAPHIVVVSEDGMLASCGGGRGRTSLA